MTREETLIFYYRMLKIAEDKGVLREAMRDLALNDLFYLLVFVLGVGEIANNEFVFARCREVQNRPNGYLDLWAREHFKSTIITYAKTIQDILTNPNWTFGIFSVNNPNAQKFLVQIKRSLESNELLKSLFPDILYEHPHKESPLWSVEKGIIVKRQSNVKEATVESHGLFEGSPTGRHFDCVVYDDVIDQDYVRNPETVKRVAEQWALSLSLGKINGMGVQGSGVRRYVGTRYHFNDVYNTILERGAAIPRIYAVVDEVGCGRLMSDEVIAEKRREMGPYIFGCQMMQNPKADDVQGFKSEWVAYQPISGESARIPHHGMNMYLLVDPAGSKKKGSDYTVMLVIGLSHDGNYYLVDAVRDRMNLTERAAKLFEFHKKYNRPTVGYERYGMQADIEHIQHVQAQTRYNFPIIELGGQTPKVDRIRKLVPIFEQGRMYLPVQLYFIDSEGKQRDFIDEFIKQEYLAFPVGGHDDMLDCMARIVDPALGAFFPDNAGVGWAESGQMGYAIKPIDNFYKQYLS